MTTLTPNPKEAFDSAITVALERAPQPAVPVDFAIRVRAALPPAPAPRRASRAGQTVAVGAAALLTVALFMIAPHTTPTFANINFDVELLVLTQLLGITYWLAAKRGAASS